MIHLYNIEYRGYLIKVVGDEFGFGTSAVFKDGEFVAKNEGDLATISSTGWDAKFWVDGEIDKATAADRNGGFHPLP